MSTKILVIDPGVPFGWALFNHAKLVAYADCTQRHQTAWQDKADRAAEQFNSTLAFYLPQKVYCEEPFYIPGHAAADSGALVKLAMVVGRIMQITRQNKVPFEMIPVRTWLGQMTAVAVRHRVSQILGEDVVKGLGAHALDAVGMGLHIHGLWL